MSHIQLLVLFLLTVWSFSIFTCKEYNQSYFSIDHLVMSMYRVISYVIARGCLLWPVHSLYKSLLAFALLQFVLLGQTCLLLQVSLDFLFCIPITYDEKDIFFDLLVLDDLVSLHRIVQLLQHQWLGYRLGVLYQI